MFILSWPRYLRLTNSIPVQTRAPCTCYRGSSGYKRAPGLENAMEIGKQWWIVSRLHFSYGPVGLKSASSPQCCSRQLDPRFCSSTSWFSGQPRPPWQQEQNMAFFGILAQLVDTLPIWITCCFQRPIPCKIVEKQDMFSSCRSFSTRKTAKAKLLENCL